MMVVAGRNEDSSNGIVEACFATDGVEIPKEDGKKHPGGK
jgi:hypothetical protein